MHRPVRLVARACGNGNREEGVVGNGEYVGVVIARFTEFYEQRQEEE